VGLRTEVSSPIPWWALQNSWPRKSFSNICTKQSANFHIVRKRVWQGSLHQSGTALHINEGSALHQSLPQEVIPLLAWVKMASGSSRIHWFVLLGVLFSKAGANCLEWSWLHVFSCGGNGPLQLLECPQSDWKVSKTARLSWGQSSWLPEKRLLEWFPLKAAKHEERGCPMVAPVLIIHRKHSKYVYQEDLTKNQQGTILIMLNSA
jgi:hypothetical protein